MDRSKRTATVVGVAVLLAAVASLGMYRVVSRIPKTGVEMKTVDVVVAQHPLKLGTRLTKDHVKLAKWPADTQMPDAFAKVEDVVERGVIVDVGQNEPLTTSKLAPIEAGAGLPPSIPQGMRAISVKVNEVIGVAGFVVPGTRVDVMVTLQGKQNNEDSTTRVVVSNAQVLTAGTRFDQENTKKEGKPIPTTVVTLLVAPEDGERIALAASEGQSCWRCAIRSTPRRRTRPVCAPRGCSALRRQHQPRPRRRQRPARRGPRPRSHPSLTPRPQRSRSTPSKPFGAASAQRRP